MSQAGILVTNKVVSKQIERSNSPVSCHEVGLIQYFRKQTIIHTREIISHIDMAGYSRISFERKCKLICAAVLFKLRE